MTITAGHAANSFAFSQFLPTKAVAVSYLPVLMYQWQGFELQSNAAQEMVNPKRDVPVAILWSAILSACAYILGVLGLLLVIPLKQMSNVSGLYDAFHTILPNSPLTGVFAVLIIIGLLASGTTWLLGVDRAFAASGYDGNIPRFLGHYHKRFGTPDTVAIVGACVSTLFLTMQLFLQGSLGAAYQILLYMAVLAGTAPYLFMFPALLIFRYRYPNIKRPYQIPGGMVGAWICVIIGLLWIVPSFVFSFLPSGLKTKPATVGQIALGVLIALAISTILYWLAAPQRRGQVKVSLVDETDTV
jgi:amino acid transporter